jgi:secreted PhoX family phosphatase
MDRRSFLRSAAVTAAAAVPFHALTARLAADGGHRGGRRRHDAGYGPLFPTQDATTGLPLIALPAGFRYMSFGWTGDPLADGTPTPGAHDGMAPFPVHRGQHGRDRHDDGGRHDDDDHDDDHDHGRYIRLVRNHERGTGLPFAPGTATYDGGASGGTTTVLFDQLKGRYISAAASLSGTIRNCAGGATPWGSWLTCEETMDTATLPHGYIFEVPADDLGDPRPIRDMGRFSHEAVALDPRTGYVYETEDAGSSSGFYRFVPHVRGRLEHGGRLSMLKVKGTANANLGASYPDGTKFRVQWVPIATPDNPAAGTPGNFVWSQGQALGAATFARLEGCWYGNDRKIYVVSTNGGIGQGQIWEYSPEDETIALLFQSPDALVLNNPDNITVSPRGGLVLCEDGGGEEFLHGLTVDGEIFQFAKNTVVLREAHNAFVPAGNYSGSEWAGACFSPNGKWLFANIQSPGITFAITGPWRDGAL